MLLPTLIVYFAKLKQLLFMLLFIVIVAVFILARINVVVFMRQEITRAVYLSCSAHIMVTIRMIGILVHLVLPHSSQSLLVRGTLALDGLVLLLHKLLVLDIVLMHLLSLADKGISWTFIPLTLQVQQVVSYDRELFVSQQGLRPRLSQALIEAKASLEAVFAGGLHHHGV